MRLQCYTDCIMSGSAWASATPPPNGPAQLDGEHDAHEHDAHEHEAHEHEAGRPSLRERKKAATRRAIRRVALDLVVERGYSHVTVEDIAERAEVSPRTFFNYFASKEAAILGTEPNQGDSISRRIAARPATERPMDAVRAVLVGEAFELSRELAELGGDPGEWLARLRAAQVDPHLRAAQAAKATMVERAVVAGVAARMGRRPGSDPYCLLLAGSALGVMRSAIAVWASNPQGPGLAETVEAAFGAVAAGFPDDWRPAEPPDDRKRTGSAQ